MDERGREWERKREWEREKGEGNGRKGEREAKEEEAEMAVHLFT